jgi:hypothetical protein
VVEFDLLLSPQSESCFGLRKTGFTQMIGNIHGIGTPHAVPHPDQYSAEHGTFGNTKQRFV